MSPTNLVCIREGVGDKANGFSRHCPMMQSSELRQGIKHSQHDPVDPAMIQPVIMLILS